MLHSSTITLFFGIKWGKLQLLGKKNRLCKDIVPLGKVRCAILVRNALNSLALLVT